MKRKGTRRRNAAPSAKQIAARKRFAAMARSGALKRKRNSRKRTAAKRPAKRKRNATKSLFSRVIRRKSAGRTLRRKNKRTGTKKRRRSAAKRATTTVKRRRRRVAAKAPVKRKRRRAAKRTTVRRKRRRVAAKKAPVRRKRRKNGRRTTTRRRRVSRKRRSRNPKRRASKRRVTTKRRAPARRRRRTSAKRRTAPRRRRVSKKRRANSRRRRRNSSGFFGKLFRRNPAGLVALAVVGAGGYFAHRLGANLISMALAKMPSVAPYSGVVGSVLTAVAGIPLVLKVVDDVNVKQSLVTGMFVSAVQGVIVGLLKASSPAVAEFLSGDDTAAKLSAMYGFRGLGQGTSIMPHYAPINGMGEYFATPMGEYMASTPAMGEYFASPMGEYFESGVEGLGNYTGNPYAMQAAAGYGAAETANTNHVDPSSNLDHELTIAEAAAGVGQLNYQAAAGMPRFAAQAGIPRYEAQAGFGNVEVVPSASTWIPGSADPQLWAGARAVDRSQEETAETAAGVLATPGGAGILG